MVSYDVLFPYASLEAGKEDEDSPDVLRSTKVRVWGVET